jgi:hypothetical protein
VNGKIETKCSSEAKAAEGKVKKQYCQHFKNDYSADVCGDIATHRMMALENRHQILGWLCWYHAKSVVDNKIDCRVELRQEGEREAEY